MLVACRRPQELVQTLQLWGLIHSSLGLYLIIDAYSWYFCAHLHIFYFFKLRILKSQLINFFGPHIAAGLDSLFLFLFVSRAACFVVSTLPILSGLVCREDAPSGVCHIRCVRMPIGYRPPTGAIPANQLSASWPFRWCPDPDGRWSVWLVAVSTGTAGWGGGMRGGGGGGVKRTRPEGEKFSWPVTPVPVLLSPLNSSSAGVMTASLGRFTPCFTCNNSLSLSLVSCYKFRCRRV